MIERQYDLILDHRQHSPTTVLFKVGKKKELLLFFCIDKCALDSLLLSTYHHDCMIKHSTNVPGCLSKIYMYTAGNK